MKSIKEVEKMKRAHNCVRKFKKGIDRHVIPNSYIVMMKEDTIMLEMVRTYYNSAREDNYVYN